MNKNKKIWVIIPAAGVGKRMQSDTPKQYLLLNKHTVIEHTLSVFDSHPAVSEIIIAISKNDEYWSSLNIALSKSFHVVDGGKERCDSVLNALSFLQEKAHADDWVMVHDAARPCLRQEDLTLLIESLQEHEVGGVLAIPVHDTMKRSVADTIKETVNRENLWHALTPQMFHYKQLKDALESALMENKIITDEASAIELAGHQPLLVEGHSDNIKITRPEDLDLAAFFIDQQKENV